MKSEVLGSFFFGYLSTQIVGGWLSDRFGAKFGIMFGVAVLSLGSLLSPTAARLDPVALVVIRVIQGIVSGFAFPCIYGIVTVWSSPGERATLMSLAFSGITIANIVTYPLSSLLCKSGIDNGWPMVFYVFGGMGVIWTLAFYIFAYASPEHHPKMSNEEKIHLTSHKTSSTTEVSMFKVPWLSILCSVKLWAILVAHLCSAWTFYLLAVNLPTFLSEALGMPIVNIGISSSVPFIGMLLFTTSAKLFDYIKSLHLMSFTNLRKLFNTIGKCCTYDTSVLKRVATRRVQSPN